LEIYAMDGATTFATPAFRTPPRILIPKLVKSRDGWKTKANQRKKRLKAARVRIRDLVNSRDHWKDKANGAENRNAELERQLEQAQQDLAALGHENGQLRDESKKK
jgi:chromosome segregation ATPase